MATLLFQSAVIATLFSVGHGWTATVNCTSMRPCTNVNCPNDANKCSIDCFGENSCVDITIDCGNVILCNISCMDPQSCSNSFINGSTATHVEFNLYSANPYTSPPPANDTSLMCPEDLQRNSTCEIYCHTGDIVSNTRACNNLNIYSLYGS